MAFVYLNGRVLREEDACISVRDRGFLYGDGLFETIKASRSTIYFLDRHLKRLKASCQRLNLAVPFALDLKAVILELLERNRIHAEAAARLTVTRGEQAASLALAPPPSPTVLVTVRPHPGPPPEAWKKGLRLSIETELCQNPKGTLCDHKSLNYLLYLLARQRAVEHGYDEAVLLNTEGQVCECAAANIFFFRRGRLQTPSLSCGLLPGIVREVLIECLGRTGEGVEEVAIGAEELTRCEEVFVTNSLLEIMPVASIGGKLFSGRDRTGAVRTAFLAFRDAVS